ncbi:MAG: DUF3052 domain-containing protein [Pelagibacterium sp. SCN 63-23]|nr:MAG: DUF3052 domain-containing protein [Pelagibacterium sp. SCN 63-23]
MVAMAGYSGTPLAQKLGLKDGSRVLFVDLPMSLADLVHARAYSEARTISHQLLGKEQGPYACVQVFTAARLVLETFGQKLRNLIAPDGMVWVSWPKKTSKVASDLNEDGVREILLPLGLVDVKVCAVDETWSGLKLVIRKGLR